MLLLPCLKQEAEGFGASQPGRASLPLGSWEVLTESLNFPRLLFSHVEEGVRHLIYVECPTLGLA